MENHGRRAERIPLQADIEFRRPGEHRWRVNIQDISPQGCRVELPIRVAEEETVWVNFPGLEAIQGRVCWVDEWTAGIEFDRPLHSAVFEMVERRMRGDE